MPTNLYFNQHSKNEQNLVEDLFIESIKMYGIDVYYIPRVDVDIDKILNEPIETQFSDAYMIELYLETIDSYEGDGALLGKFGIEVRSQLRFQISKRRWELSIGKFKDEDDPRPLEGDLIYVPKIQKLFEIKYTDAEKPFWQLLNTPAYTLTCELFEYSNEMINTEIGEIDNIENLHSQRITITLGDGSGNFQLREEVHQQIHPAIPSTGSAIATIDSSGSVDLITIGDEGFGYTTPPSVTIEDPDSGGTTATATAEIDSEGKITNITITNAGSGYSTAPAITISTSPATSIAIEKVIGRVAEIRSTEIDIVGTTSSLKKANYWKITDDSVNYQNIIGQSSGASYKITKADSFANLDAQDPVNQNVEFENEANEILDFSEDNPFGEPDYIQDLDDNA